MSKRWFFLFVANYTFFELKVRLHEFNRFIRSLMLLDFFISPQKSTCYEWKLPDYKIMRLILLGKIIKHKCTLSDEGKKNRNFVGRDLHVLDSFFLCLHGVQMQGKVGCFNI